MDPLTEAGNGGLRLYALAQDILEKIREAGLAHVGSDLPNNQFVIGGEAAYDCEQVSVAVQAIPTGIPGNPESQFQGHCNMRWSFVAEIAIVRCAPKMEKGVIPGAKLSESLKVQSVDAEILMMALDHYGTYGPTSVNIAISPPSGQMMQVVARFQSVLP